MSCDKFSRVPSYSLVRKAAVYACKSFALTRSGAVSGDSENWPVAKAAPLIYVGLSQVSTQPRHDHSRARTGWYPAPDGKHPIVLVRPQSNPTS